MMLNLVIDEKTYPLDIPDGILHEAEDFFQKMDRDMDRGWQMGTEFVEIPTRLNRCQIAADRLLISLSAENQNMIALMAGYILTRLPGVTTIDIDTAGEMLHTKFFNGNQPIQGFDTPPHDAGNGGVAANTSGHLSRIEAMEEAGKDVSKVYKVGKAYRFAVRDRESGQWMESAPIDNEKEALELRTYALKKRYDEYGP